MAQAWPSPALTRMKAPAGGIEPPKLLSPQHSTAPLGRRPQVCASAAAPVATCVNAPDGGVDGSLPQHVTLPSSASAQACAQVIVTLVNDPAGGTASPSEFSP